MKQLKINGEMHSNISDVTTQFLAELRVSTHYSDIVILLRSWCAWKM